LKLLLSINRQKSKIENVEKMVKKGIAFDIEWCEGERKVDSTKVLSPVQKRLESWKPSTPSKHGIDSKLDDASRRRVDYINKSAEKNKIHQIAVKNVCKELQEEQRQKENDLENRINKKLDVAADNKSKLQAETQEKLSKAMKDKKGRRLAIMVKSSNASKEISDMLAKKLEKASARKEKLTKDKLESIHQSKENRHPNVGSVKTCPAKVSLENRLNNAEARRGNLLEKRIEVARYHSNKKDLIHDEDRSKEQSYGRKLF